MPLPQREIADSFLLTAESFQSTLGETLGATIADPLLRPTQLLADNIELQGLNAPVEDPFALTGELIDDDRRPDPESFMQPDEVKEEFEEIGLTVAAPTPRPVVELLAKHRREQMIRDDIIARGPQGAGVEFLKFGTSLAGAFVDPINLASAFFPVVSQARFAGLVARRGLASARLTTGVVEGFAGAAAVEPLTFSLSDDVALDYEMTDALANFALGGILGGGLHVVGGAGADFLKARRAARKAAGIRGRMSNLEEGTPDFIRDADPQVREDAMRAAVAQTVEGKDVSVDALFPKGPEIKTVPRISEEKLGDIDTFRTWAARWSSATQETSDAIKFYTYIGNHQINRLLRTGDFDDLAQGANLPRAEASIADMKNAMDNSFLPQDLKVFRGGPHIDKLKAGDVLTDGAFMSTAVNPINALPWANIASSNSILRINLRRGQKALTGAANESEIILPTNTQIIIRKISKDKVVGKTVVEADAVPERNLADTVLVEDGSLRRVADPGQPFARQEAIAAFDEKDVNNTFDLETARKQDAEITIPVKPKDGPDPLDGFEITDPDGTTMTARAAFEEADELVTNAENLEPAIKEAGNCLSA